MMVAAPATTAPITAHSPTPPEPTTRTEDQRDVRRQVAAHVVVVAVADPGRGDPDPDLTGARRLQLDLLDAEGLTGLVEDSGSHVRDHYCSVEPSRNGL